MRVRTNGQENDLLKTPRLRFPQPDSSQGFILLTKPNHHAARK